MSKAYIVKDIPIQTEAEIAVIAKIFLELNNWSLYPEVDIDIFNGRPDYVGVKNGTLCKVIECKKSLSYPLIEQLARWQIDADKRKEWQEKGYNSDIAVPHLLVAFTARSNSGISSLKHIILKKYRIGVYTLSKREIFRRQNDTSPMTYLSTSTDGFWKLIHGNMEYEIRLEVSPTIIPGSRQTAHKIISRLNEDMLIAQAGVKGGETEYMTPFKRTMNRVRDVLDDGKERHIQHIINDIKPLGGHHYCSDKVAMASIAKFIDKFSIARRTRETGAWFVVDKSEK